MVPNLTVEETDRDRAYQISFMGQSRQTNISYEEEFGDIIKNKETNTLRIGFQNIGGFSTTANRAKDDVIRIGISKYDFDIFGMAELNIDWRMSKEDDKLYTRTREWWEHLHLSFSNNTATTPCKELQYGGTAIFSLNKTAHRVISKGQDASKLGRWCWTRYRGKQHHTLRIITAYRPNPPGGPFTVYAQHRHHFNNIKDESNWIPYNCCCSW